MEEIIIKEIKKLNSGLVIVKYNGNREATLNTKWQSQEVDYLENDVGIGGRVIVEIVQKGKYINVTKIDMTSGKKNEVTSSGSVAMGSPIVTEKVLDKQPNLLSVKDIQITAQCMVKCACYGKSDVSIDDAIDMYHKAVLRLETEG